MSIIGRVIGRVLRPIIERQAKGRSVHEFMGSLERSGEEVAKRLGNAPDTPHNREVANHIVGIERWGQRRLRVALGEPPVMDSYRGYRLPEGVALEVLCSAFSDTRRGTVELARELRFTDPKTLTKVRHNDLGELIENSAEDGDALPFAGGLQVFHVPGHCAGQIALVWPRHGGVLVAADAASNMAFPWQKGLGYPPIFEDLEEGKRSLKRLARLEVEVAVFGHGEPILKGAGVQLRERFGTL